MMEIVTKVVCVEGMKGEECRCKVEKALNAIAGVEAQVSLADKKAKVKLPSNVSDAELEKAIRDAGYTVTDVGLYVDDDGNILK